MSQHHHSAPEWVPRDDMAVLIRKSPDTVSRTVAKHGLATRTDDAGRVLVNVADFITLGHLRPEDLAAAATPAESAALVRAGETITALQVQVGELTGRLQTADLLAETLGGQLAQKDRQIAKQADHLTALIGRLSLLGGAA